METVERVLDDATRKLLAETGMLGFTENPKFVYVPKAFREKNEDGTYKIPKEHWPKFHLEGKDGIESAKMEDTMGHMEFDSKTDVRRWVGKSGSKRIEILKGGIKGWENWFDNEGKEIPFRQNQSIIHNESLKRIPVALAIELANAITDRITLTPEETEGL